MISNNLKEFRKKMFLTAYPIKVAHLASAFSVAEIIYVLYTKIMKFDKNNIYWKDRDRFILSKGHGSLAVYAALNEVGIISDAKLTTFCRPGDSIGGEVNPHDIPGIETATGSLGHGLGFGVGQAIALKMDKSPAKVYVIVGNGEIQEGVIWESIMSAYKFELDNLVIILDDNKIQKMGKTIDLMKISSWNEKFQSFGLTVDEIKDGHDIYEIERVLSKPNEKGKPRVVIANTVKGKGVSIVENNADWHFKMPYKKELKVFMEELDISEKELENAKIVLR